MPNEIGSIRAALALESAAFIRDMKKAADATARNTSAMQRHMAGLSASFARAGAVLKGALAGFLSAATLRAFASLANTIIQTADEISTAATKMGLAATELQRLRFAADQADVGISELDAAFRKFQTQLATGKLAAEGRSIGEAFANFIDRIREAPTLLEKTRIAQEGLGSKSAQTGLLLASAGDQFRENFDQAFVVSDRALEAAGLLDNEWKRLTNSISAGFATGYLETFADNTKRSHEELTRLNNAARFFGELAGGFQNWITNVATGFASLRDVVKEARDEIERLQSIRRGQEPLAPLDFDTFSEQFGPDAVEPAVSAIDQINLALGRGRDVAQETADANRQWIERLQEGAGAFEATRTPLEAYNLRLWELGELLRQNSIDAETFGRAQGMAAASAMQPWLQVADTIGGALGSLFEDNKGIAIAQAVINTAQGITAALAQYPPPLSFAMAAAQAAAGAVQIAKIKSTKAGSGASAPSVGGGRGARVDKSSAGGASGPAPLQDRAVFINLQGSGRYSREEVLSIISGLIDAQKDGAKLVLSQP